MRLSIHAAFLLWCSPVVLFSQQNRLEPGQEPPRSGVAYVGVTTVFGPLTLENLVKKSDVIIEGEVESPLGSRYFGRVPYTDFQISVKHVLKAPPDKAVGRSVIIDQVGGKIGAMEMINEEDPLIELGQRFFLFLKAQDRKDVPDFGFPRYSTTGVHYGRIRISDDRVKLKQSQHFAREFQDRSSEDLRNEILRLKQK